MTDALQEIISMLKLREEVGKAKYGTDMDRKDLKGSDWAQHALEELLDMVQYLLRVKKDLEKAERHAEEERVRRILND